jgi:cholinesterase
MSLNPKISLAQGAIYAAIVSTVLSLGIAIPAGQAQARSAEKFSQIYVFGDSYSDDGQLLAITTRAVNAGVPNAALLPADPALGLYDRGGRWTNGPTAVETLAKNLRLKSTNYAVGGGKSGNGNFNAWLDSFQNTGVFGQVSLFKSSLKNQKADSKALYFIFVGTNDYFEYAFLGLQPGIDARAKQAVANVEKTIKDLANLGAKQFFVVNSTDLALLPGLSTLKNDAKQYTTTYNSTLPAKLNALRKNHKLEITAYDHVAISTKVFANPQKYGLSNLTEPCQPVFSGVKPACTNPDQYYFWDEYHPTKRAHQIIGEDMTRAVKFRHLPFQGSAVF